MSYTYVPNCNSYVYINNPYDLENPRLVVDSAILLADATKTLRSAVYSLEQLQDVQNNFSECETSSTVVSENGDHSSVGSTPTRRSGCTTPQPEHSEEPNYMTLVSRVSLVSYVPFYAYDSSVTEFSGLVLRGPAPPEPQRPSTLKQVFFGQLPVNTSDSVVVWLCKKFANADVLYIERLQKRYASAENKCCMQVFVHENHVNDVLALNKRVLFDVTGVWHIENDDHVAAVERHLEGDKGVTLNFVYPHNPKLPSRTIVVELATSTYVRGKRKQNNPLQPLHYFDQAGSWWYSAEPPAYHVPCNQFYSYSNAGGSTLPSYHEAASAGACGEPLAN